MSVGCDEEATRCIIKTVIESCPSRLFASPLAKSISGKICRPQESNSRTCVQGERQMEKEGSSLSPEDSEIRRAIWEGAIPIVFSIAQDEVTSLQPPFPYYVSSLPHHFLSNQSCNVVCVASCLKEHLLSYGDRSSERSFFALNYGCG